MKEVALTTLATQPAAPPPSNPAAPRLGVRLACMLYEALLLFGILFIAGWLFSTLLQQRHALYLRHAQQAWLFLVLGLYFAWFWSHGGQTLAMKTWRIRVVDALGRPPGFWRAAWRYLLAWGWFLPGLALAWALDLHPVLMVWIPVANMVLWGLTMYLDPQRQFLHDRIAGTRLIRVEAARAKAARPKRRV